LLGYVPEMTEVAPVSMFQTWTLPSLTYATRAPSSASVAIGSAVCFTLFGCGLAAPACVEKNSKAAVRNSPTTRSVLIAATVTPAC